MKSLKDTISILKEIDTMSPVSCEEFCRERDQLDKVAPRLATLPISGPPPMPDGTRHKPKMSKEAADGNGIQTSISSEYRSNLLASLVDRKFVRIQNRPPVGHFDNVTPENARSREFPKILGLSERGEELKQLSSKPERLKTALKTLRCANAETLANLLAEMRVLAREDIKKVRKENP